ncbi:MAG: hypothetical protein AB7O88_17500 [Reyranellaceae bacterium]
MSRPSRFAVHDMRSLEGDRRRRSSDWDIRFVTAVLMLYGCIGAAFFAVEWMHAAPDDAPVTAQELRDWGSGRAGPHPLVRPPVSAPSGSAPSEGR